MIVFKESDRLKIKYQRRNKLKMIAKKKPHVIKHNLGRKKLETQTVKHQANIKTNEDVLQADMNAARNVLARLYDNEISRWTPFKIVKSILLKRTECHRLKLLNQDSSYTFNRVLAESELPNEYIYI